MIDTYVSSKDKQLLEDFLNDFKNVLRVDNGKEAVPEKAAKLDTKGVVLEEAVAAKEAIGDTTASYSCIRTSFPILLPEGITEETPELAAKLVGVWL